MVTSSQNGYGGSGGLSTGAKAGISVGAVFSVLCFAVLVGIFILLSRNRKSLAPVNSAEFCGLPHVVHELHANEQSQEKVQSTTQSVTQPLAELPGV